MKACLVKGSTTEGQTSECTWVFGGIEKSSNKCFFPVVQDRLKDTLRHKHHKGVYNRHISDCWKTCDCLEDECFLRLSVSPYVFQRSRNGCSHKLRFVERQ
ncbi:hypothetical protein TNCV_4302341 [Trichonephila clavipes]|nr:hypothetical protein TNCV_4302341 [Trichonephila clavipes]